MLERQLCEFKYLIVIADELRFDSLFVTGADRRHHEREKEQASGKYHQEE
ncbi:hypothetical protein D777_03361 [Marinobacter nitratireducens]|uniref:Uncharacterized protein n=1 Tax=Marinobacter nitratireducens TaxID=1137280 RepID=A0A072NAV8_9GAMM|nr:hypothetical protein D777_03361 [Marinobacter nitratireducens]